MKKRTISMLMLLSMLASLTACGGEASTDTGAAGTSGDSTVTESPYDENGYLKSSLPDELDFGGAEVTVLWWNDVERPEFFVEDTKIIS